MQQNGISKAALQQIMQIPGAQAAAGLLALKAAASGCNTPCPERSASLFATLMLRCSLAAPTRSDATAWSEVPPSSPPLLARLSAWEACSTAGQRWINVIAKRAAAQITS